jgi:hypothetical protein
MVSVVPKNSDGRGKKIWQLVMEMPIRHKPPFRECIISRDRGKEIEVGPGAKLCPGGRAKRRRKATTDCYLFNPGRGDAFSRLLG